MTENYQNRPALALVAGGFAGLSVDVSLFPLDTIKTRLQGKIGFTAAGGFKNIYNGIGPAVLGSAPNAAVFFCTYEYVKSLTRDSVPENYRFVTHALAASFGEVAACLIRVPAEVIKQRHQVAHGTSSIIIFKECLRQEGFRGLYRGYWSTVMREIPFSFIQYPLWEFFKGLFRKRCNEVESWQSAVSGACAGGIAAAITTPLDVAKTRIMLASKSSKESKGNILETLSEIYRKNGIKKLYSGVAPRTLWMSLGGAIYFGAYEFVTLVYYKKF